uniref:Uncharacterized protein n=1 Tax=Anguilla anguilla TaxID=7936 RepID=A0A0E9WGI2_ANGAN
MPMLLSVIQKYGIIKRAPGTKKTRLGNRATSINVIKKPPQEIQIRCKVKALKILSLLSCRIHFRNDHMVQVCLLCPSYHIFHLL